MYAVIMGLMPLGVMGIAAAAVTLAGGPRADVPPCERCGGRRWRTVRKGVAWRCRRCGKDREAELADVLPITGRLSAD